MSALRPERVGRLREATVVRAPAKLNLRLVVLGRDESGYHQIETLFVALGLSDRVRVERGGGALVLDVQGQEPGPPGENLAYQAAVAFFREVEIEAEATIELEKRIPVGAGLGGGSSDAAATLRALDRLYGEPLRPEQLLRLAVKLGSDVAFFLSPSPLALGWGRGARLLALPPVQSVPVLVAVPGPGIATTNAYRWLDDRRAGAAVHSSGLLLQPRLLQDWDEIARLALNDFEPVVFTEYPHLERMKRGMADTEPRLVLMTGTGSALFAIYRNEDELERAHASLSHHSPGTIFIPTQTLTAMPEVGAE
ncbi:MAG: 4-(cytidine 5'-diphospho)-2-C-methyl-D-erythritol kinase [Gemmatimonadetes bacterium]|nr:4-(cytidine 5'-diphospho)-2-C-methyl-D-erythritol kinase [Gemmatimonadota bacterium]